MPAKIKFPCTCGKSLSADPQMAGRKAKCPNCGQVVTIPAPQPAAAMSATPKPASARPSPATAPPSPAAPRNKPAASAPSLRNALRTSRPATPPAAPLTPLTPTEKSLWDDAADFGLEQPATAACPICAETIAPDAVICVHCGSNLKTGERLVKPAAATAKRGLVTKLLSQPWWMYPAAFIAFVLLVRLVEIVSIPVSMILVAPPFFLGGLLFAVGVLSRLVIHAYNNRDLSGLILVGMLLAMVGVRPAALGAAARRMGRKSKPRTSKPQAAWPGVLIKLGGLALLFAIGATTFGKFTGPGAKKKCVPRGTLGPPHTPSNSRRARPLAAEQFSRQQQDPKH